MFAPHPPRVRRLAAQHVTARSAWLTRSHRCRSVDAAESSPSPATFGTVLGSTPLTRPSIKQRSSHLGKHQGATPVSLVTSSSDRAVRTADRESSAPGEGLGPNATESLTVEVRTQGIHHVLSVTGEIDLATAPELSEVARGLLDVASHIVIDLDQVSFIDSTGLSVLVAIYRRITSQGGSMALVCNSAPCMRVMEMTGLSRVFTFCASTADAVGAGRCASGAQGQKP